MDEPRGPDDIPASLDRVAMIARWKPVHLGHAAVLEALTARARRVTIGIGSANRHDASNPFTPAETVEMIRIALAGRDNFKLVAVPDLGHGPRWRALVSELLGPLDLFVTANPYVRGLMREVYPVAHPAWLVPRERHVAVDGTMVRARIANGEDWRALVSPEIADYLERERLIERFLREFGAETRGEKRS